MTLRSGSSWDTIKPNMPFEAAISRAINDHPSAHQAHELSLTEQSLFRENQKRCRDLFIQKVCEEPWTYVPLRKAVEKEKITREDAETIILLWSETIARQEKEFRERCPEYVQEILEDDTKVSADYVGKYSGELPVEYRVKPISEQVRTMKRVLGLSNLDGFSNLDEANLARSDRELKDALAFDEGNPTQIDGTFYIPPMHTVADIARKRFPVATADMVTDDEVALWYALRCLNKRLGSREPAWSFEDRVASNYPVGPRYERLHPKAALAHAAAELRSPVAGSLWPIQTGPARRAERFDHTLLTLQRGVQFKPEAPLLKEVPVDSYVIACMLLTHPERLTAMDKPNWSPYWRETGKPPDEEDEEYEYRELTMVAVGTQVRIDVTGSDIDKSTGKEFTFFYNDAGLFSRFRANKFPTVTSKDYAWNDASEFSADEESRSVSRWKGAASSYQYKASVTAFLPAPEDSYASIMETAVVPKEGPYALLGVSPDAPPKAIKDAYRKKVIRHHPDSPSGYGSDAKMRELNEAWEQVIDDQEARGKKI